LRTGRQRMDEASLGRFGDKRRAELGTALLDAVRGCKPKPPKIPSPQI